jgi:hypothetical protein
MCSGSPSGVGPPNWRYLETVQPSNPAVCSFLNSVCPPGHQRLVEGELLFPEGPIPEMFGKAGLEQIDRLDDVRITRNDKFLDN